MDDWFIPGHSVDQERRGADVVQQRRGRPDGSSKCVVHCYSCSVTNVLAIFGLHLLIHHKHDHFMTYAQLGSSHEKMMYTQHCDRNKLQVKKM